MAGFMSRGRGQGEGAGGGGGVRGWGLKSGTIMCQVVLIPPGGLQPTSKSAQANVMYIPRDPTSGATIADILVAGVHPVLSPHTVAEVRLSRCELVLSEYL